MGVKLHPLFQDLSLADPKVLEILAALAEEGMPVVSHVGAGGDEAANERGRAVSCFGGSRTSCRTSS